MRLVKEKIKLKNEDVTLKIELCSNNNLNGLEESINDFVQEEIEQSINSIIDGDKTRFLPDAQVEYIFNFFNSTTSDFTPSLLNAGFTNVDISNREEFVLRSFYIIQLFDSINIENQILIHNGYYNGFNFIFENGTNSSYLITEDDEFSNFYILNNFINEITGSTTVNLFAKFLFYNAKTGKLQVFFNEDNENLTTEEKMYFQVTLDLLTKTYTFFPSNILNIKELVNEEFVDKTNDTLSSFVNEKPTFPTGTTFNTDGKYDNNTT